MKDRPPGNTPIRRQTEVGWMWGTDGGAGALSEGEESAGSAQKYKVDPHPFPILA